MKIENTNVVVAWCRCGPFAEMLDRVRKASEGDLFDWTGSTRWVDRDVQLAVGQEVELCEADLCHCPGLVRPLGAGRITSILRREGWMSLSLAFASPQQSRWQQTEHGKLVCHLRDRRAETASRWLQPVSGVRPAGSRKMDSDSR